MVAWQGDVDQGLGGRHVAQVIGQDGGVGGSHGRVVDLGGGQGTGLCGCHDEHRAVDQGSGEDGEHNACQVG